MIPGLIFLISLVTLLQFFISYIRSLIAESRTHELSGETREMCGLTARTLAGDQFQRLSKLIALCAETGEDGKQVLALSVYFRLLEFARCSFQWAIPSTASWIEAERDGCAYAAALLLDRRIAHNRMILAQQSVDSF